MDWSMMNVLVGDGIYTSTETFVHDEKMPYTVQISRSLLEHPIVDTEFEHLPKLQDIALKYRGEDPSNSKTALVAVECPISFGGSGCRAAQYGWCSSCCFSIDWDGCSVTFG